MFKKHLKTIVSLLCISAAAFVLCFIYGKHTPMLNSYELIGNTLEIYHDNLVIVAGYIVEDNRYTPISNDPQLLFFLDNVPVRYVKIELLEPMGANTHIQVFYDNNEELSEENSIRTIALHESEEVILEIPYAKYNIIRIDIDGVIAIGNILVSDDMLTTQSKNTETRIYALIIAIAIIVSVALLILAHWKVIEGAYDFIQNKSTVKQIYLVVVTSIFFYFFVREYYNVVVRINSLAYSTERLKIIFALYALAASAFAFELKTLLIIFFRFRYIIGISLLVLLVANDYNYSSIGVYDTFVQQGSGSEFVSPLFNQPQRIRSDEWLVGTPSVLSGQFLNPPYSEPNTILRAAETPQLGTSGVVFSYSVLGRLSSIGFLINASKGVSFIHWFSIFTCFFGTLELFYIITNKQKYISLAAAICFTFAPFSAWWSYSTKSIAMPFIAVSCFYYFVITRDSLLKKILFGLGVTISTAHFVIGFYPAWQVPTAYIALAIVLWIIADNTVCIKQFRLQDYLIIVACIAIFVSIVGYYLKETREYNEAMMNTAYPGNRIGVGGGGFSPLFNYWEQMLYPFKQIANPSEPSTFFSLFPIPLIGCAVLIYRTRDKLSIALGALSLMMLSYIVIGWPEWLAKGTLLSYTTTSRIVPIFGLVQTINLFYLLSRRELLCNNKALIGLCVGALSSFLFIYYNKASGSSYLPSSLVIIIIMLMIPAGYVLLNNSTKAATIAFCSVYCAISLISTLTVNPLTKGLDAIYSKPASSEIQRIVHENPSGKWVAVGFEHSAFLVANGAPTLNSVNFIPNMNLWRLLDPAGNDEYVYNRYAHISIILTHEEVARYDLQGDIIYLNLPVRTLLNLDVEFVFSPYMLSDDDYVRFREMYFENGAYIYEVVAI